ncbi:MAG TPA: multidrug efflux RND transporter permease subunit [Rariglobus sp.]|jgi:hydrophobe/amphiphile efflux-1 (HAE1) family protein|nr:multidrug efflux RND transporter permease subunit [Rariglobus sp.]
MNVSEIFIRRPVATSLLMVAVILLGALGYSLLPVSALPNVDFPTLQVTTQLPGASPDVMTSSITTPLEQQFGQISGLTSMNSVSSAGISTITLQFALDRDIDSAAQDVQAAINVATGVLPSGLPNPPSYKKVNPADAPILTLAVTSDSLPIDKVNDYADTLLAQKLSEVTGVGLVSIEGNLKPAVRVQINPAAIAAQGLSLEDVRTAITQAGVNAPKGSFDGAHQAYAINANDQIFSADDYRKIIVAYRNGAPVRLTDIGRVVDGVENTKLAGWRGNKPAIILDIQRQPGANIIETVDRIKTLLPKLLLAIPPSVHVEILTDRTTTIRASVADVQFTLMLTIALVVMVIFVFLRKLWATVIPSIALPLAVVGTFGVMKLVGFSLDNLSLMALTIATGFVVDDAIVMIENIVRYIEKGDKPFDAALKGSKQIGFTVISLTVSLIAVFIPLLFMTGIVGRLFREFAITLSVAVVMSAIVSLTLTPMMCARLLTHETESEAAHGRFYRITENFFDGLLSFYDRGLKWVLNHQPLTLAVAIATLVCTLVLYTVIPKGLLPQQDTGIIIGVTDAAQNISFNAMATRQQKIVDVVQRDPDVASVTSFVGIGTINPTLNTGRLSINLKPRDQRSSSASEIITRLRAATASVEGISLYMQAVQDLQIDSRVSRTQYQYTLADVDPIELADWAPRLVDKLRSLPELAGVASDQQTNGYQIDVTVNRDKASRLNILPADIDNTLYDAFGQRQVATIFTQLNQYRVILEVEPAYQKDPDALGKIYIKSSSGQLVPLNAIATTKLNTAPLVISHQSQFPAVTISFNLRDGYSLSHAVEAIAQAQKEIALPDTIQTEFSGSAAEFQNSLASEPWLILAAIIVVYIVLGVLYESYIHPVTILSTLPSAGVGALLALIVCRTDFSMVALIGIVLLIGIVKKNAIMMIDFALEAEREQGLPPEQSIYQACLLRFRPIMMTTMAALLGALPLALENGTGSELRRPLGIVMIGGLLVSQVLTLYTTPVIYLYMDRLSRWLTGRPRVTAPAAAPETAL